MTGRKNSVTHPRPARCRYCRSPPHRRQWEVRRGVGPEDTRPPKMVRTGDPSRPPLNPSCGGPGKEGGGLGGGGRFGGDGGGLAAREPKGALPRAEGRGAVLDSPRAKGAAADWTVFPPRTHPRREERATR